MWSRRPAQSLFERFHALHRARADLSLAERDPELIGDGALSVGSLPMLGMGRDVPDGVMRLGGDRLEMDWNNGHQQAYFERVNATMRRMRPCSARNVNNPMWLRKRVITVHPVGGAPDGARPRRGGV